MSPALTALCLLSVLASPLDEGPAVELRYTGTLTPRSRDGAGTAVKQFSVYCLVKKADDGGRQISTLVDERGGSGWSWPERFGQITLDANNQPTNKFQIRLLHDHDGTLNPLELRQPIFRYSDKLQEGENWNEGTLAYEVGGTKKVGDHNCRMVEVATNFGRREVLAIDKQSGLLVSMQKKLFMGRGDEFEMKMQLESVQSLTEAQLESLNKPVETLAALKKELNRKSDETKPELDEKQIESATAVLQQLEEQSRDTVFNKFAAVISRDVKSQSQRAEDVDGLAKKFVGRPAPELDLVSLTGKPIKLSSDPKKITVLHIWEYQGEPLAEPYGQVGYLDFLNSRRRKLGVEVVGVAVDKRLKEKATKAAALRSIRSLQTFMNISYPIAIDDGTLLKSFGDPRSYGAKLPLWVVIAPDGKVAHYHVGFYSINPDEGLRELDEVVIELIREARGK